MLTAGQHRGLQLRVCGRRTNRPLVFRDAGDGLCHACKKNKERLSFCFRASGSLCVAGGPLLLRDAGVRLRRCTRHITMPFAVRHPKTVGVCGSDALHTNCPRALQSGLRKYLRREGHCRLHRPPPWPQLRLPRKWWPPAAAAAPAEWQPLRLPGQPRLLHDPLRGRLPTCPAGASAAAAPHQVPPAGQQRSNPGVIWGAAVPAPERRCRAAADVPHHHVAAARECAGSLLLMTGDCFAYVAGGCRVSRSLRTMQQISWTK